MTEVTAAEQPFIVTAEKYKKQVIDLTVHDAIRELRRTQKGVYHFASIEYYLTAIEAEEYNDPTQSKGSSK